MKVNRWRPLADIPSERLFAAWSHTDSVVYSVGGRYADSSDGFSDTTAWLDVNTGMVDPVN